MNGRMLLLALALLAALPVVGADAHHVLGRPSYSLGEDSNTPPSLQADVMIGDYMFTYMIFPAFPRPGQTGRINLYGVRVDSGVPYEGKVTFKVRADPWYAWLGFGGHRNRLGVQSPDDRVFRQGFVIPAPGDYIVSAEFEVDGEAYVMDFPLRVGEPSAATMIGLLAALALIALVAASLFHRRRTMTVKVRDARPGRK